MKRDYSLKEALKELRSTSRNLKEDTYFDDSDFDVMDDEETRKATYQPHIDLNNYKKDYLVKDILPLFANQSVRIGFHELPHYYEYEFHFSNGKVVPYKTRVSTRDWTEVNIETQEAALDKFLNCKVKSLSCSDGPTILIEK